MDEIVPPPPLSLEGLPEAICVQLQYRLSFTFSAQYVHCSGWRKLMFVCFFLPGTDHFDILLLCGIERDRRFTCSTCSEPTAACASLAAWSWRLFVVSSPWHLSPYCRGRRQVIFWQKPMCHLWAAQDSSFIHKHNPTCNQIHPPCFCYSVCS